MYEELTNSILPQEIDFSSISAIKEIIFHIAEIKANQLFLELELRQALDIKSTSTQKQGINFNSEYSINIDIGGIKSLCGELNVFGLHPIAIDPNGKYYRWSGLKNKRSFGTLFHVNPNIRQKCTLPIIKRYSDDVQMLEVRLNGESIIFNEEENKLSFEIPRTIFKNKNGLVQLECDYTKNWMNQNGDPLGYVLTNILINDIND